MSVLEIIETFCNLTKRAHGGAQGGVRALGAVGGKKKETKIRSIFVFYQVYLDLVQLDRIGPFEVGGGAVNPPPFK